MHKFTALMPMKGHSVRVKNKNLRPMAGLPLFHYVLGILDQANWIYEIIVNTDSEEIGRAVQLVSSKVVVQRRHEAILGDAVTMNPIIEDCLRISRCEHLLQVHSTSPLLSLATLERAKSQFVDKLEKHDSLFSVNRYQSRFFNEEARPLNHDVNVLVQTQDLSPLYEENSGFYFFTKTSFNNGKNRIGKTPQLFVTPKLESIDIDTEEDFAFAERLIQSSRA